jgi:C4-dicarboxylate-specific signal transduction histidine kinase
MLGELSGAIAHELRQPLTTILANAQAASRLLANDPPDLPKLREVAEEIVQADRRAAEVLQRLRPMLKRGETSFQPLGLNEVAREVLTLAEGDLRRRDVSVLTRLQPGLPAVAGDRVQLQQVLLNLILNGCDAMQTLPRDERQLTVATGLAEDGAVYLGVEDRGTGIPGSEIEQIFQPFYTSKADGLGLGLAICRTIVAAHGGRLWATNNPVRGATLHVSLPRADTSAS